MHFDPFKREVGLRGETWLPEMRIIYIKLSNYLKDLLLWLDVMQVKANEKRSLETALDRWLLFETFDFTLLIFNLLLIVDVNFDKL